jgi:deoxyribonuclease V
MNYRKIHDWNISKSEAVELQKKLRHQVIIEPLEKQPRLVAGCDISFNRFSDVVYAGVVVLELPELEIVDRVAVVTEARFEYFPGLLSFRETPALLEAWERLETEPDVVMLDGQGMAHPRRFGIACHFGVLTGLPTIGCAKTVLTGKFEEPKKHAGSYSYMEHKGEIVGAALRTKENVAPVYVSVGNRIDLEGAIELTLRCVKGYRLKSKYRVPEPTRQAHLFVNEIRRSEQQT